MASLYKFLLQTIPLFHSLSQTKKNIFFLDTPQLPAFHVLYSSPRRKFGKSCSSPILNSLSLSLHGILLFLLWSSNRPSVRKYKRTKKKAFGRLFLSPYAYVCDCKKIFLWEQAKCKANFYISFFRWIVWCGGGFVVGEKLTHQNSQLEWIRGLNNLPGGLVVCQPTDNTAGIPNKTGISTHTYSFTRFVHFHVYLI